MDHEKVSCLYIRDRGIGVRSSGNHYFRQIPGGSWAFFDDVSLVKNK